MHLLLSNIYVISYYLRTYYVYGVAYKTPRSSDGSSFYDWLIKQYTYIHRCNLYDIVLDDMRAMINHCC